MSINISNSELKLSSKFDNLIRNLFLAGSLFLFISGILYFTYYKSFFFSYLNSFFFYLSLSLGAMFLVLLQYLTRAGWSVVVRRVPEVLMKNVGLLIIFFIPLLFGLKDLYHWMHPEEVMNDYLLQVKAPYLNALFFSIKFFFTLLFGYGYQKLFFRSLLNKMFQMILQ